MRASAGEYHYDHNILKLLTDKPKVESAKETLEALNPDVKVVPYKERLICCQNISNLFSGHTTRTGWTRQKTKR